MKKGNQVKESSPERQELEDEQQEQEEVEEKPRIQIDKAIIKSMISQGDAFLNEDIRQVEKAIDMFLNSDFDGALDYLKSKYCKSLYYTLGYGVILMLKASMTFDASDIEDCMVALDNTIQVASALRKENTFISSFTSMFTGSKGNTKDGSYLHYMTRMEQHAELVYAEAYLLKALLSLLTDNNIVAFVKEGIKIRSAYSIFKSFYKFLRNIYREKGQEGLNSVDEHLISGILYGNGIFNLILSMMPERMIKIFELVGFSGSRQFAMSCLEIGAKWSVKDKSGIYPKTKKSLDKVQVLFKMPIGSSQSGGLRVFLCDLSLLVYHIIFANMIQLPDSDIPLAQSCLETRLQKYPNSFLFLTLRGRLYQSQCSPKKAQDQYNKVLDLNVSWRNLVHLCFWDLGFCKAAQMNWLEAADCFDLLLKESKWSPAVYTYLKAVCLYESDSLKYESTISELMSSIPSLTRKIAGKSIPLEKFVVRKARKYQLQEKRLLLPGYEIIYMWSGFDVMPQETLDQAIKQIEIFIKELDLKFNESHPPYKTYYDDVCLARFFKGVAIREYHYPSSNTLLPSNELIKVQPSLEQKTKLQFASKQLEYIMMQADHIDLDHWILPFARFELGQLHMRLNDYPRAKKEFLASMSGGYGEDEVGIVRKRVSMENALHFRAHNSLVKLKVMESLLGGKGVVEEGEDSDIE